MLKELALLLAGTLATSLSAVTIGNWEVTATNKGLCHLKYGNHVIFDYVSLAGYAPQYKNVRFAHKNTAPVQKDNSLIWKFDNDAGSQQLELQLKDNEAKLVLDADMTKPGPLEFGVYFDFSSFYDNDGNMLLQNNGRQLKMSASSLLPTLADGTLFIQLPSERHQLKNLLPQSAHFAFQDKRKQGESIRYITAIDNNPGKHHVELSWTVKEYDGAIASARRSVMFMKRGGQSPVEVANSGFESGVDGWNLPQNAALDHNVCRTGKAAARLQVTDPDKEGVYITRKIPVEEGAYYAASCWVKTENVRAVEAKRGSVGAGLIVEWSDKDGNWLAAGEYACEMYGTNEWTMKSCRTLRAPRNAGFAEIYLTLRGAGTAWYDDFEMQKLESSVAKLCPLPEAVLQTNTPKFSWNSHRGAKGYTLRLSRNPSFPEGETRVIDVPLSAISMLNDDATVKALTECGVEVSREKLPFHQLTTPLEPGTWYWRVDVQGAQDRQAWKFTQTVPVAKDCLPPEIRFNPTRVYSPSDSVELDVFDEGTKAPSVKALYGNKYLSIKLLWQKDGVYHYVLTAPDGWQRGFSEIEVEAQDIAGNRSEVTGWLVCVQKPENSVVIRNGHYEENGKSIFPLGIYEVTDVADMRMFKQLGFNCVHTYKWEGSRDDDGCRDYLERCWNADGMRAFIGFDRTAICNGELKVLAERIGKLSDHPGLFCWYLFDEPEITSQYVSPELLTDCADLIRTLDPYHPVVVTTWGAGMNAYRKSWDTHWTQAYERPAGVVKQLDEHERLLKHNSPITLLLNCVDFVKVGTKRDENGKWNSDAFELDYDWMRAAAFAGISRNVNGLWWWWFARHQPLYFSIAWSSKGMADFSKMIGELNAVRRFLASSEPTQRGETSVDGQRIVWCIKSVGKERLLIVVNTGDKAVSTTVETGVLAPVKLELKRYGVFLKTY